MKLVLIIGATLLICFFLINFRLGYQSPRYVKLAHKITDETAEKLKKKKNLSPAGTGGSMMNDVKMMMMAFQFFEVVDMDAARELLVYSTEEYLTNINSNKELRPYLHNYPFTSENVEIVIYFSQPNRGDVPLGNIAVAAVGNGSIVYYTKCSGPQTLKEFYEEPYQDALKIVASEGP